MLLIKSKLFSVTLGLVFFAACTANQKVADVDMKAAGSALRNPAAEMDLDAAFRTPPFNDPVMFSASMKDKVRELFEVRKSRLEAYKQDNKINYTPRDTHVKSHGCVKATFKINDEKSLDPNYRVGLFKNASVEYPTWIRFANGVAHHFPDLSGDGRSMAIKVMNVEGAKLLDQIQGSERSTHDFIVQNSPAFNMDAADDAVEFFHYEEKGYEGLAQWIKEAISGTLTSFKNHPRLKNIYATGHLQSRVVSNLLTETYWSGTPYKFGSVAPAVRYIVKPCAGQTRQLKGLPSLETDAERNMVKLMQDWEPWFKEDFRDRFKKATAFTVKDFFTPFKTYATELKNQSSKKNYNYLSDNLREDLKTYQSEKAVACFDFGIEIYDPRSNGYYTPVNQATVPWKVGPANLRWLAQIYIHGDGDIHSAERKEFCEKRLAFNVWNAFPDHQPLGEINAVRGLVYRGMSLVRRHRNNVPIVEPDPGFDLEKGVELR